MFSTVKSLRPIPNCLPPGTITAITRKSLASRTGNFSIAGCDGGARQPVPDQAVRHSAEVDALAAATADQNPVFRFKIDFVRRRVIPSLKKITPPADPAVLEAADPATSPAGRSKKPARELDAELATAMAAVDLMQSERAGQPSPHLESLMQWCAASPARSCISSLGQLPFPGSHRSLQSGSAAAAEFPTFPKQ